MSKACYVLEVSNLKIYFLNLFFKSNFYYCNSATFRTSLYFIFGPVMIFIN